MCRVISKVCVVRSAWHDLIWGAQIVCRVCMYRENRKAKASFDYSIFMPRLSIAQHLITTLGGELKKIYLWKSGL